MSIRYLLLKLAEEAGELVVAAIKHRLHRTAATQAALEGEVADVLAIISLLRDQAHLDSNRIGDLRAERIKRERKRMEKR